MEKFRLIREIPIEEGYDLVIAGGGPAGTVAAVSAARLGARVLLLEAMGCLGGMGTSGQAAATAAVQAIREGTDAAEINTRKLIETLRGNGAFLPQEELSDMMTRA